LSFFHKKYFLQNLLPEKQNISFVKVTFIFNHFFNLGDLATSLFIFYDIILSAQKVPEIVK